MNVNFIYKAKTASITEPALQLENLKTVYNHYLSLLSKCKADVARANALKARQRAAAQKAQEEKAAAEKKAKEAEAAAEKKKLEEAAKAAATNKQVAAAQLPVDKNY